MPAVKSKKAVEEPAKKKKTEAVVETKTKKSASAKNGKVTVTNKKKKKSTMSARDCVLKVLTIGSPRDEIKARAKKLATEEGADVSFKTFDVGFFLKHLADKGYTVSTKKSGLIKVTAPAKGEEKKPEAKTKKTTKAEAPTTKKKAKASK